MLSSSPLLSVASNLFHHRPLIAREDPSVDPREAPRESSRRMFWELAPEDVIGKPAELQCAKIERGWKRTKHKMEKVSKRAWTENIYSPGSMQLREYTLREFWEIFVDDRPFGAEAMFRHVNVKHKQYSPTP